MNQQYFTTLNESEIGYYMALTEDKDIDPSLLLYLIGKYQDKSIIKSSTKYTEIGPLLNFKTPWCSNALRIFQKCKMKHIDRIEQTSITLHNQKYDKMTHADFHNQEIVFQSAKPNPWKYIPYNEIDQYNKEMSLSLDDNDVLYYTQLFRKYGRYPTDIELYDLAQSNSEHSRHSFFNGELLIQTSPDALKSTKEERTLMNYIKLPLQKNKRNSILAFCDNASAIHGHTVPILSKEHPNKASRIVKTTEEKDICFTAETHNFPTSIAPFPGAATGTGGRIRDNQAIGRGGLPTAGTAGYCVGNLHIPNYNMDWEQSIEPLTNISLAKPLDILIQASNGASDYGNKFGEPIIQGFTRSYGNRFKKHIYKHSNKLLSQSFQETRRDRIEWLKPIMFTGGLGMVTKSHLIKKQPENGMVIIRLGGPAYRIGMGGGAASSRNHSEKDNNANFNAVQRGDPQMENKVNRVIKGCIELQEQNPIISIHDQGAGGTANVTKEIVYPNGALINVDKIISGDDSLSILEKWVCEYQEQVSILVTPNHISLIQSIAERESCPCSVIGYINDSKKIQLYEPSKQKNNSSKSSQSSMAYPVDLNLEDVLGKIPQKKYVLQETINKSLPLDIPDDISIEEMLHKVLRLVSVGSKRFLTNKVDRSVTGLIAQQQCVGPLQTPLANVAVTAQSYYSEKGSAMAIGEQPIKGLIDSQIMARMSIGEMLTNLVWAKISHFEDIKCSGNWMWAGKDETQGYHLYMAVKAVSELLEKLKIAIDGGKDSMSMKVNTEKTTIKSPNSFVVSGYAPCPNIEQVITPDLKRTDSHLFFIDLANHEAKLGGSALAQVYNQIGDEFPDIRSDKDIEMIKIAFEEIQKLIGENKILAGHDRSDGGLITTIIEMCIAGDKGCQLDINPENAEITALEYLFAEELGLVIEIEHPVILNKYVNRLPLTYLGRTTKQKQLRVNYNTQKVVDMSISELRDIWENTSFEIEKLQANPECVKQEKYNVHVLPKYHISNELRTSLQNISLSTPTPAPAKPKVAILREEGSNGDAEMAAAFEQAGFDIWDVNMNDLIKNPALLQQFQGIAFVGGFSYSDVFGAAKGWAAVIKHNKELSAHFKAFYNNPTTFSLGVCNGCQLMAELEWIPKCKFERNTSQRFESRFSTVKINKSNAIMLKDLENTTLGVWVAHGEGRYTPSHDTIIPITPIVYVDPGNHPTMNYPFNPNGSKYGVTAVASTCGRHLAMMPHPERCFLRWQLPYEQPDMKLEGKYTPWFKLFTNAYEWCIQNKRE